MCEDGSWRGELLGLEVARIVRWPSETGGDGELHLEAGVGRFDRDAVAAMHDGESPSHGLRRAVAMVSERRHRGATAHPLSFLARARWLRADAIAEPALVGASELRAAQTTFCAGSVRDDVPAAAIGTTLGGAPLVVVFAAGAGLDLTPVAADTREFHLPGAVLRLAVAPRDHLVVTDELAAAAVTAGRGHRDRARVGLMRDRLEHLAAEFRNCEAQLADPEVVADRDRYISVSRRYKELEPLAAAQSDLEEIEGDIDAASELLELAEGAEREGLQDDLRSRPCASRTSSTSG